MDDSASNDAMEATSKAIGDDMENSGEYGQSVQALSPPTGIDVKPLEAPPGASMATHDPTPAQSLPTQPADNHRTTPPAALKLTEYVSSKPAPKVRIDHLHECRFNI